MFLIKAIPIKRNLKFNSRRALRGGLALHGMGELPQETDGEAQEDGVDRA